MLSLLGVNHRLALSLKENFKKYQKMSYFLFATLCVLSKVVIVIIKLRNQY